MRAGRRFLYLINAVFRIDNAKVTYIFGRYECAVTSDQNLVFKSAVIVTGQRVGVRNKPV